MSISADDAIAKDSHANAIIGAGLVGSLQALFLLQQGETCVHVYDRRSDSRSTSSGNAENGRSINLALSRRGMEALRQVGVLDAVLAEAVPMRGRFIHEKSGCRRAASSYTQLYSSLHQVIYSIDRTKVHSQLLNILTDRLQNGSLGLVHFDSQLERLDIESSTLLFHSQQDDTRFRVQADRIYGCDGAFSKVRSELIKQIPSHLEYAHFEHEYKELIIPAAEKGGYKLDPNWLHIWPRKDFMLIALPNLEGTFTATLFYDRFESLRSSPSALEFFQEHFPDFVELMGSEQLTEQFCSHPVGSLITYKTRPLAHKNVVLLGDAGHAVLPFYGQGMNAGFEDLLVLDRLLESKGPDSVFARFNTARLKNADAIHELALENYREMRKDVLEWRFRAQCWLGRALNWCFPTLILPRYTMIAFTTLPYSAIKPRELKTKIVCSVFVVALAILIGLSSNSLDDWLLQDP